MRIKSGLLFLVAAALGSVVLLTAGQHADMADYHADERVAAVPTNDLGRQ